VGLWVLRPLLAYFTSPGWKTCPSATLSTTNPTWLDTVLNLGRRGGKPATNRLSALLLYQTLLVSRIISKCHAIVTNWKKCSYTKAKWQVRKGLRHKFHSLKQESTHAVVNTIKWRLYWAKQKNRVNAPNALWRESGRSAIGWNIHLEYS
jgi:hypothetical protein